MFAVRGESGVEIELLDLWCAPTSKVLVGNAVTAIYTWRSDGRIVQMQDVSGATLLTESSDGRPTLVVAEQLDECERLRPVPVGALDLLTGAWRWRRTEKVALRMRSSSLDGRPLVEIEAPHGAHLFEVDTGLRRRAPPTTLSPGPKTTSKRKAPKRLEIPEARYLPMLTVRRAMNVAPRSDIDRALAEARRAFFFSPESPPPAWVRTEPSPVVWALVQELRRLEGKPSLVEIPRAIRALDLPPDVQAVLAAGSERLRSQWGVSPKLLPQWAKAAEERRAPRGVRAFGASGGRLLCAQPTPLGDRVGIFDGMRYRGPLPIEALLSEHCWQIAEARRDRGDGDVACEAMHGYAERVLGASTAARGGR